MSQASGKKKSTVFQLEAPQNIKTLELCLLTLSHLVILLAGRREKIERKDFQKNIASVADL